MRMTSFLLVALLAVLLGTALAGNLWPGSSCSEVQGHPYPEGKADGPLFVLVHGFDPDRRRWEEMADVLRQEGSVLRLTYDARPTSNADAKRVAIGIGSAIAAANTGGRSVVIVAHSMGALLARRALLDGLVNDQAWAQHVERLVLLAGMNRGWAAEGPLPPDASIWLALQLRLGHWLAGMLHRGQFLLDLQRGSPFVANLRLEWMQQMRNHSDAGNGRRALEVVQLLGDIDDFVHREDNEDLRTTAMGEFALLRVRGTGHGDILEFHRDSRDDDERRLGEYRRDKMLLAAASKSFKTIQARSEVLRPPTDPDVTDIVFVLHGIRDVGRWSSRFEEEVHRQLAAHGGGKPLFVSPRYGYLGMGPFLFESVRSRYVRWFMDEYTEALARYPNVETSRIRFFGHSNGTYLLADALRRYESMRIGNVVLAGSVVPTDFRWSDLCDRVGAIRSYAGTHDWVVAWFPRIFEWPALAWLSNPLGGGGFHGFSDARVENVLLTGAHSAFAGHEADIVAFLMTAVPDRVSPDDVGGWKQARQPWQVALGSVPAAAAVWLFLISAVAYLAVRVVGSAPSPQWPVLLLFVLLMVAALRTV